MASDGATCKSFCSLHLHRGGGKGRRCVFCPCPPRLIFVSLEGCPRNTIVTFQASEWKVRISNFQSFFSPTLVKEHSVLAALLWWKRRSGPEQRLPVCGREAQHDAEADRGGPGLACSFVNSMTMKSKLFLTQFCGSLLLFPSPLWAQNNF